MPDIMGGWIAPYVEAGCTLRVGLRLGIRRFIHNHLRAWIFLLRNPNANEFLKSQPSFPPPPSPPTMRAIGA